MIPYGRQNISEADINSVIDVLRSNFLTQGPTIPKFENRMQEYCRSQYAVAVNSATSALHLACLSLGLGKGDILWTSPISFVASSNAALYCGASVDFVDIDFNTNNMSISSLQEKLIYAKKEGTLPKVVIPVHMGGHSCDMSVIHELSKEYNFKIIEDASHAVGGKYKGKPVGSCEFSDITIFSFHPVKIITTGEGGMALTNDKALYQKMTTLRTHGITRNKALMHNKNEGAWYYEQLELGLNYRITEMQAALGYSQMDRLDTFVSERNKHAAFYQNALSGLAVTLPVEDSSIYSSYHLFIIKLESKCPAKRRIIFDLMRKNNIGVNVHYIPIHLQPFYKRLNFKKGDFPVAEAYYDSAISIPLYPDIGEVSLNKVARTLSEAINFANNKQITNI
jgi:UDP-4-amino-4,6-dideoxy-N-acetyl-beta-L-altrosamine transaminase